MEEWGDDYSFNSGDCDIYAVALHRLYGYPLYLVRGYYEGDEEWVDERGYEYEPCHILVKLENGNYLDSNGEQTGDEVMENCYFSNDVIGVEIVPVTEDIALSTFSVVDQEERIMDVMDKLKNNGN
jgi:hypothetical protein